MPRYFFHCEGAQNFFDDEGTEVADISAARVQAVMNAGEILRDHAEKFADSRHWRVFVTDAAGGTVFALQLRIE